MDQVLYAIEDLPDDRRPLKFNLKWDVSEQSRTKVQYFISQAVLQACVEAAANGIKKENLTFNFSYPEAYDYNHAIAFKRQARIAVEVGLKDKDFNVQEKTNFRTESISSTNSNLSKLYFRKNYSQTTPGEKHIQIYQKTTTNLSIFHPKNDRDWSSVKNKSTKICIFFSKKK